MFPSFAVGQSLVLLPEVDRENLAKRLVEVLRVECFKADVPFVFRVNASE